MRLTPDRKAGLYITVSVHLAVIIVLLAVRIGYEVQRENSFVLDFTQQEELERQQEQAHLHEIAEQDLEHMLEVARAMQNTQMRNVAVDRSTLKDDKGIGRPAVPGSRTPGAGTAGRAEQAGGRP